MSSKRGFDEADFSPIDSTTKRARRQSILDLVRPSNHLPINAERANNELSLEMPEINSTVSAAQDETVIVIDETPPPESIQYTKAIKQKVLARVNGRARSPIYGLDTEYAEIYNLLEHTIVEGEGNSCLLIGPRSCGKTLIVDTALDRLKEKYQDHFITIRLSGFSQGDDKMAVREICRQFDVELSKGFTDEYYDGLEKKGMSDTLQSLLDLLDPHPTPFEDEEKEPTPIAVVIILEEFDRFTQVSRQTLLYNLFDLAQSSRTPIAVVGVTSRMNTRELFEKRVKSRFSQRVYPMTRPRSLDDFWQICRATLTVSPADIGESTKELTTAVEEWNKRFDDLYATKDSSFFKLLESTFYTTKDLREFYDRLLYSLQRANPLLVDSDISKYSSLQDIASTQAFLQGLSELELSLLICASRAEIKFESEVLNFNVVYDEYLTMATTQKQERMAATSSLEMGPGGGYRIWSREVARSAWERLENLDLVLYVDSSGGCSGNSNGAGGLNNVNATSVSGIGGGNSKGGAVRDDLKMAKVDVNLLEIRQVIGNESALKAWTRI